MTAEMLREVRSTAGISQADLARRLKLSQWALCKAELGRLTLGPVAKDVVAHTLAEMLDERINAATKGRELLNAAAKASN